MNLSIEDQHYDKQSGLLSTLYSCELLGFANLISKEEMHILSQYYFVDREVDVDYIYEFRRQFVKKHPETVKLAQKTLHKIAIAYKVHPYDIKELFE